MVEIILPFHVPLVGRAERKRDLTIAACIDVLAVERLDEDQRLGDACLELLECRLVVLKTRRLDAGEARGTILGHVARDLHLTGQREHVRGEPPIQQHRAVDFLGGGKGLRLVEEACERVEFDLEYRKRGLGQGERHRIDPWLG